jgi:hypothetical protein
VAQGDAIMRLPEPEGSSRPRPCRAA